MNSGFFENVDRAAVASFSRRLGEFDRTLTESDRRILSAMLRAAMDPLDRMRLREAELLSAEEKALLEELENEPDR